MKRSRSPGGKKKETPSITNNITNNGTPNLHNYFPPVAGPTTAKPDERPPNLFPPSECVIRAYSSALKSTYYLVYSTRGGELLAGCSCCSKSRKDIETFTPPACLQNHRKRADFFQALSDYYRAYQARDLEAAAEARQRVVDNRTLLCPPCQETRGKLSPAVQACKDLYNEARDAACLVQDGCSRPACVERGPQAACVLQGDHVDQSAKPCHKASPSDYCWWACHGGVEALRAELPKLQWICGFCHQLEKTGKQANRCGDPDDPVNPMPEGRQSKDAAPEEVAQYKKRRNATIRYHKQKYVDAAKFAVGACAHCRRVPTEENVWCFHWDHLDETKKLIGKDTLAGVHGGVSGIVANNTKASARDAPGVEEALDAEMAKCQLLCINCHHRKTHNYPRRA